MTVGFPDALALWGGGARFLYLRANVVNITFALIFRMRRAQLGPLDVSERRRAKGDWGRHGSFRAR